VCASKAVVNSISLKEGEEAFIAHAKKVRSYGAAMVVMPSTSEGRLIRSSARCDLQALLRDPDGARRGIAEESYSIPTSSPLRRASRSTTVTDRHSLRRRAR